MPIRAVVFDAVGTLIHPEPRMADVYAEVGLRHGNRLDLDTVRSRFKTAFQRQDDVDRSRDWATDEPREAQRWRDIVADVFDVNPEKCFADLFAHFARPDAWRVDANATFLIESLKERGLTIAMASNFDARLHDIVAGLPALRGLKEVIVSSQVGVRKPARAFFAAIEQRLGLPAAEITFVGDDPVNDDAGAKMAGMKSILLGRDVWCLSQVDAVCEEF